jgi:hypothetical protein
MPPESTCKTSEDCEGCPEFIALQAERDQLAQENAAL